MPSAAELIASINELPAEEHAAFVTAFQNDGGAVVKQARSKAFAAGKSEGGKSGTEATAKLTEAQERITELEGEVEALNANQPDYAAKEQALKDKHAKALADKDTVIAAKDATLVTALRAVDRAKLRSAVLAEQADGTRVNPEYADDDWFRRFDDRLVVNPDGTRDVLKPGEAASYDAADADAKIALLAADIRKTVKPAFMLSNADTGAGVQGGGGLGGGRTDATPTASYVNALYAPPAALAGAGKS